MSDPAPAPARVQRILALVAACLVAALGGALAARHWLAAPAPPVTEAAAVYAAPRPLPPFELVARDGARFDRGSFAGHYTFVFFGFTNCPYLCPTTLAELAQATRLLADLPAASRPAVVMVSVDPERDTPALLARYVEHFDARFVGVTGSDAALTTLATAVGAAYQRTPEADGSYSVDHSAAVFLIDPESRLAAVFPTPQVARTVAADYRRILAARGRS
jgi:protein SCO1/2